MLFILIPIAWLLVVTLLVAVCRMTARADAARPPAANAYRRSIGDGLVLWEDPPAPALASRRPRQGGTRPRGVAPALKAERPAPRKRRIATHGVR